MVDQVQLAVNLGGLQMKYPLNTAAGTFGYGWQVVEFQHVKPGKGAAFVRAKIKNLET